MLFDQFAWTPSCFSLATGLKADVQKWWTTVTSKIRKLRTATEILQDAKAELKRQREEPKKIVGSGNEDGDCRDQRNAD